MYNVSHQSGRLGLGLERDTTKECQVPPTLGWELQLSDPAGIPVNSDESKAEYLLSCRGNRGEHHEQRQEEHAAWGHVHQDRSGPFYNHRLNLQLISNGVQHNCGVAKNKYSKILFFFLHKELNKVKKTPEKLTKNIAMNAHQPPVTSLRVALYCIFWTASQIVLSCSTSSKVQLAQGPWIAWLYWRHGQRLHLIIHMVKRCILLCSCETFLSNLSQTSVTCKPWRV